MHIKRRDDSLHLSNKLYDEIDTSLITTLEQFCNELKSFTQCACKNREVCVHLIANAIAGLIGVVRPVHLAAAVALR